MTATRAVDPTRTSELNTTRHEIALLDATTGILRAGLGGGRNVRWMTSMLQKVFEGLGGEIFRGPEFTEATLLSMFGLSTSDCLASTNEYQEHLGDGQRVNLAKVFLHPFFSKGEGVYTGDHLQKIRDHKSQIWPLGWRELVTCFENKDELPTFWSQDLKEYGKILFCATSMNFRHKDGSTRTYVPGLVWGFRPQILDFVPPQPPSNASLIDDSPAQVIPRASMFPAFFEVGAEIRSGPCAVMLTPQ